MLDDFDKESMMKKDFVELEVLSGKRFLLENDWAKVYDLVEKSWYSFKWSSKFPFVSFEKHRYCTFKFKTVYCTLESVFDKRYFGKRYFGKRYNANCNLSQLAALFDIDFKEFDTTMMNHDVAKL